MPYRGRDDRAVWACAIARTTRPLQCQLAPWKSNEALFVFFLWSEGVKPSEIYRRMKVEYGDSCLSQGCMNGCNDFKTDDKTSVMNTGEGDRVAWQLRQ